jgi:hypothetical protein
VLERHIEEKLGLSTKSSFFTCDAGCARYGCRGDLVVGASFLDIAVHAPALAIAEGLMEQGGR